MNKLVTTPNMNKAIAKLIGAMTNEPVWLQEYCIGFVQGVCAPNVWDEIIAEQVENKCDDESLAILIKCGKETYYQYAQIAYDAVDLEAITNEAVALGTLVQCDETRPFIDGDTRLEHNMYHRILVTDIVFNNGEPFTCKLPIIFCENGYLAAAYLRPYVFNCCEVTYNCTRITNVYDYDTQMDKEEPYDVDLVDAKYDNLGGYVDTTVNVMNMNSIVVSLHPDEVEDTIGQLVFEELLTKLHVDFIINQG